MSDLWNFVAYQLAWFAVILGAANGFAWAGAMVALLIVVTHLWRRRQALELQLVALSLTLGFLVDTTLAMTGQVRFSDSWPASNLAPYWMLALWVAFATTLNHSMRWVMRRPVVAGLLGAVGAPLAYLAGARLGALTLENPAVALPVIGALWLPAMVAFSMIVLRADLAPGTRRLPA